MIKTKQELLNHFSDINEKYNNPFMYQTLSNMIDALLEQEPCENCISREEAEAIFKNARKSLYELSRKERVKDFQTREMMLLNAEQFIHLLPSVTPKFTDTEIQKMQELEQAQLEKAYELGKTEMQPCDDAISRKEVMAIIEWAYDECKIDGYTDYCEMRDMVKGLQAVTPKAETITEFADRCRECGAKYGKLLEVRQKADGSSNEFFNFDSPMVKGESENED